MLFRYESDDLMAFAAPGLEWTWVHKESNDGKKEDSGNKSRNDHGSQARKNN